MHRVVKELKDLFLVGWKVLIKFQREGDHLNIECPYSDTKPFYNRCKQSVAMGLLQ